jgi:hypothetical protein
MYNPAALSPLYSLLAAPLLALTRSFYITQYLISVAGWILFFGGLYKVVQALFRRQWLVNIFILCAGFFLYPHQLSEGPKDTLAAAFTLWAIYFSYWFIAAPKTVNTLLLSLCIALIVAIKLLYVPLAPAFFCVLLFLAMKDGKRGHLFQYGFLMVSFVVLIAGGYYLLIHPAKAFASSYNAIVFHEDQVAANGWHPQNLLHAFPFLTSSFINTKLWGVQTENLFRISFSDVRGVFQVLDILLFACILYAGIKHFHRIRSNKVIFLLLFIAIAMAGSVFAASLYYGAILYKVGGRVFTFVSEARSFLFPVVCLQAAFVFLCFKKGFLPSVLIKIIVLLFVFECAHGLYFTVKETVHAQKVIATNKHSSAVKKVTAAAVETSEGEQPVNLVTTDNILRRYALLQNVSSYAIFTGITNASLLKRGHKYLIATPAADSLLIKNIFPLPNRRTVDTIPPFVLQVYSVE